jgi:hypothetical protein
VLSAGLHVQTQRLRVRGEACGGYILGIAHLTVGLMISKVGQRSSARDRLGVGFQPGATQKVSSIQISNDLRPPSVARMQWNT